MLKLSLPIFFILFVVSCGGYKIKEAESWWLENETVAIQIVDILKKSKKIVRVEPGVSKQYVVNSESFSDDTWNTYIMLQELAQKHDIESISVTNILDRGSFNGIVITLSASGLSTDGCSLSVMYIENGVLSKNIHKRVALIKPLTDSKKWYGIIRGEKKYCLK